jgi:hypothetical protein
MLAENDRTVQSNCAVVQIVNAIMRDKLPSMNLIEGLWQSAAAKNVWLQEFLRFRNDSRDGNRMLDAVWSHE